MGGDKIVITKDDLGPVPPSGKGFGGAPSGPKSAAPKPARGSWASNVVILLVVAVALGGLIAAAARVTAMERAARSAQAAATPTGPANWCLIIDRSGSMAGGKLFDAKEAAKDFVRSLKPDDEICVIDFSGDIHPTVNPQAVGGPGNPKGIAPILASIDTIQSQGPTALWDAGLKGVALLSTGDPARKRIMILLTDGEDNVSGSTDLTLMDAAKRAQVVIHTVALGYDANCDILARLSRETGGISNFARTSSQL